MAGRTGRAARRRRHVVLVALTLGLSATTACASTSQAPTTPWRRTSSSPGTSLRNAICPYLAEKRCAVGIYPGLAMPGIPADQAVAVLQVDLHDHR